MSRGFLSLYDGLRGDSGTIGEKGEDRHEQEDSSHGNLCAESGGSIGENQYRIAARRASRFFFQAPAPDSISSVTMGIFRSMPAQVPNEPGVG